MRRARIGLQGTFQFRDFRPHDEPAVFKHPSDCGVEVAFDTATLGLQVNELDHCASPTLLNTPAVRM